VSATTQSTMDVILRFGERFGVPCLILAAVLWMLRETATSLHSTVIVPIVQGHTQFLESTEETLREIGRTQEKQAETMQEIAAGQRTIERVMVGKPATERTVTVKQVEPETQPN
jgi:hypothetical protein